MKTPIMPMNYPSNAFASCLLALVLVLSSNSSIAAQSAEPKKTMGGFCPVTILDSGAWEKGDPTISSVYDNRIYYFTSEEAKKKFDDDPPKYVPALGGDCIVCIVKANTRIPGSVFYSVRHKNRLYLFPQERTKAEFKRNPSLYEDGDLALGGKCPVCRKGGKDKKGKPEFTVIRNDMRYQFPSKEVMDEFLRNPDFYLK